MAKLIYADTELDTATGQTVLDALYDHGHTIPNNCRIGVCQSCLMKSVAGEVPAEAQQGLKDTLKAQNYFLACQCIPRTSLKVVLPATDSLRTRATVVAVEPLSVDVVRLCLIPETDFEYQPGQYVTLWNSQGLGRCYSLASVPDLDDTLELHVAKVIGGRMSTWIFDELKSGDKVQLQTAIGDCFYVAGKPEQKLLLAGTGTGLAPLWGIVRDALHQGHQGEIHLVHGAIHMQGLYLHETLLALGRKFENFFYHASILKGDEHPAQVTVEHIEALVERIVPKPKDWKVYLCGAQELVNSLKKKVFLAGASMSNIYSDSFVRTEDTNNNVG